MMPTRKAWLAMATGGGLLLSFWLAWTGLANLHSARDRLRDKQEDEAAARMPVRGLLPGGGYRALSRKIAGQALRQRLHGAAIERRLLVETIELMSPSIGEVSRLSAHFIVSGPQNDVIAFAADIENDRPIVRFADWRVSSASKSDTAVRLEATATTIWEGP